VDESTTPVPRLRIRDASKTFGRTTVLSSVDLDVQPGEIHGLVGQNGSGKSTLIKLLSGFYSADSGSAFELDGQQLDLPIRPSELQHHGLAFVHQDLGLVGDATVVENVKIGRYSVNPITRKIDWRRDSVDVSRVLDTLGSGSISPSSLVSELSHGERASVAIARAILGTSDGAGCIVFDESTQSLPREILHEFYTQVRRLADSGTAVLIVSHRLDEVLALCDRVTVLEDGKVTVSGLSTEGLTEAELTRLILGKSKKSGGAELVKQHANLTKDAAVMFSGEHISGRRVHDANFALRVGEVVGVIGDTESGYDELPYLVTGTAHGAKGTVTIDGASVDLNTLRPSQASALGIVFVPGKRGDEGLALELLGFENVSLPRVGGSKHRFFLGKRWQQEEFSSAAASLGVTPAVADLTAGSFSGGNQQKILLSKWLLNRPKVIVLHEPTQAVDVGARADILAALRAEAAGGTTVLVSSLETDDLAAVCDRILIMHGGRVRQELVGDEISAHRIIDATYGQLDANALGKAS
jgi:ribose transport system ATP-binding protein